MRTECDRGGQHWYAREILEPKDYSWMYEIAVETLEVCVKIFILSFDNANFQFVKLRKVPDVVLPTGDNIPKNQSKVVQPSKSELVQRQQTRLKLGSSNN